MLYNTSTVSVDIAKNSNYVEAGIIENAELKSIRYAVSEKGNEFIEFTFEDSTGSKLTQTEYKPSGKTSEEELEKTIKQMQRIKQIVCGYDEKNPETITYLQPSEYSVQANDFKSFCEGTIRLLNNRYVGKKVRIKAVYSDKGFVTLPKYSKFVFIEPMTIPVEKSAIRILGIDKIVRPVLEKSTGAANPFDAPVKQAPSHSDLPF